MGENEMNLQTIWLAGISLMLGICAGQWVSKAAQIETLKQHIIAEERIIAGLKGRRFGCYITQDRIIHFKGFSEDCRFVIEGKPKVHMEWLIEGKWVPAKGELFPREIK